MLDVNPFVVVKPLNNAGFVGVEYHWYAVALGDATVKGVAFAPKARFCGTVDTFVVNVEPVTT